MMDKIVAAVNYHGYIILVTEQGKFIQMVIEESCGPDHIRFQKMFVEVPKDLLR